MGALILPASGFVYTDANTIIYTVQRHPHYYPLLELFWDAVATTGHHVLGSELLILETLVGPLKSGDAALLTAFENALFRSYLRLVPISEDVLREAARLRASVSGLRAPDAIHAATALLNGCTLFVTNDVGFRRVPGLPLAILDDVLAVP
jgi:predicted nucleic acid-binding protein